MNADSGTGRRPSPFYPFSAIAGQDRMKRALLVLAVDPGLGGVLLLGEKGTAKSTAARSLSELLPRLEVVRGCIYHCDPHRPEAFCPDCRLRGDRGEYLAPAWAETPFSTLPLGATEDRLAGGLDMERTVSSGRPTLKVGLLGQANRGVLYVDEVNLLEPYLAHILLDSAETGRIRVEREGLSLWHPARITLIGTMNPEEGGLGPQLADRFALTVRVSGESAPDLRAEIIRRRLAFEKDPLTFHRRWQPENAALAERIRQARLRLSNVEVTPKARNLISDLVLEAGVRGHRADLALTRSVRAQAAFEGLDSAGPDQVRAVAEMVLEARRVVRKAPPPVTAALVVEPVRAEPPPAPDHPPVRRHGHPPEPPPGSEPQPASADRPHGPGPAFDLPTPTGRRERGSAKRSGRRTGRPSRNGRGRYYRSSIERLGRPVALDATLRAAAPHQQTRRPLGSLSLIVRSHDLREKVFRRKTGRLVLFVVDASGSVGSFDRMSEAKAAVMALLGDAYRKRDRVGLIAFRGLCADILLPPTNSVETAGCLLVELPSGGKTPLSAALVRVHELVRVELAREPDLTPLIVLMTDGRPNVPLEPGANVWPEACRTAELVSRDPRLRFLLVDTDRGHYAEHKMTWELARCLNAPRLTIEALRQGALEPWLEILS